jgi:hypothetical protein
VKLKFKVPGTGSYACQYALYSPAGGKLFDVGAVAANTEKTVLMDVQPGGHWVRVRCTTYPLGASAAWKQSTMVRFNVFEPDKPIITSPLDEYRHFGLDKPVAVKFKVAGTSGLYSCNYVFDGAQFVIGTVKAGENSFYIARTVDPMWKDGEKHFYSVRCTPQTIATVAPTPRSVSVTPRASSNPSAIATVIPTNAVERALGCGRFAAIHRVLRSRRSRNDLPERARVDDDCSRRDVEPEGGRDYYAVFEQRVGRGSARRSRSDFQPDGAVDCERS